MSGREGLRRQIRRAFRWPSRSPITDARRALDEIERRVELDLELTSLGVELVPKESDVLVKETMGLRPFWIARGGYLETCQLTSECMSLSQDTLGFSARVDHGDLMHGDITWDDVAEAGVVAIKTEIMRRVVRLFEAALPAGGPYCYQHPYGGVDGHVMTGAMDEVLEQSPVTRHQLVVVGRRSLLTRARVSDYALNVTRVDLHSVKDDDGEEIFLDDSCIITSPTAYRLALWAEPKKTWTLNTEGHIVTMVWNFGGMVYHPERSRRLIER